MLLVRSARADVNDGDGDREDRAVGSPPHSYLVAVDGDDLETGRPVGEVARPHLYRHPRCVRPRGTRARHHDKRGVASRARATITGVTGNRVRLASRCGRSKRIQRDGPAGGVATMISS